MAVVMDVGKTIFADHAEKLHQIGLAVLPCGQDSGKIPLVRWRDFTKKGVSERALAQWVEQFPSANLGVLLGEGSGIVVIDDDDNRNPEEIFKEFGCTPLYVRTPSKGGHYYYRFNGEKSANLRARKLEIKSTGTFVLVPPSISPKNGKSYTFLAGGFNLGFIDDLPIIKPEALEALAEEYPAGLSEKHQKGERNTALFDHLRSIALSCTSEDELYKAAVDYNVEKMESPLDDKEVRKAVKSVWGYKLSGNLITPCAQYACTKKEDILELSPDEHWFLSLFKANHNGLRPEFIICVPAMAKAYSMSLKRVKDARNGLMDKGFIRQTHIGGAGKGDTNKYEFILRG